jgi:competence protein ComFB
MGFRDSYDLRPLVNLSQDFVFDAIDAVLPARTDICTCQACMLDVAAIALNDVPPWYCVGKFSSLPKGVPWQRHYVSEREKDMAERAKAAVEAAIETVKKHPHH